HGERTYAYTCYDTHLGKWPNKTAISDLIRSDFVAARGGRTDRPVSVSRGLDMMNLGCFQADGLSLAALTDAIDITRDRGDWLILVFHGIGSGTHGLFVEPSTLNRLLDYLATQNEIWVAPVVEIAKWVRAASH
ncbi:MAG TPA: hypothetical protein VLR92_09760, partial [Blastocatellia bacterium]|nr:hypothetical protein [Blastocatellia bacterium]